MAKRASRGRYRGRVAQNLSRAAWPSGQAGRLGTRHGLFSAFGGFLLLEGFCFWWVCGSARAALPMLRSGLSSATHARFLRVCWARGKNSAQFMVACDDEPPFLFGVLSALRCEIEKNALNARASRRRCKARRLAAQRRRSEGLARRFCERRGVLRRERGPKDRSNGRAMRPRPMERRHFAAEWRGKHMKKAGRVSGRTEARGPLKG